MHCYIYCRVSSTTQAERGYGIDYQERACKALSSLRKLKVKGTYKDEAISGSKRNRPSLNLMLDDITKNNIDAVVVYSLDRIGRSARVILDIIDKLTSMNCYLMSCKESINTSTQAGRFFLTIMAGLAELERETIKEKTYAGRIERAKLDGDNGGRLPYGYMRIKSKGSRSKTTINESHQPIIKLIFDLDSKNMFPDEIANELNSRGYRTSSNNLWYAKAITRIKRNIDKYKGGHRSATTRWPRVL